MFKDPSFHEDLIKDIYRKDPFAGKFHVLDKLRTGLTIPVLSFWCILLKLGIQSRPTHFVQMIREPNEVKRLEFARRCIKSNDQIDDAIVSIVAIDSTIWLKGETPPMAPVQKHPLKIHILVWNCSQFRPTKFLQNS